MASIGDGNPFSLLFDPTTPTPSKRRKRYREASPSNQRVVPPASFESVKIYYRVRLSETEGFKFVPRHTSQKDILEAPEIKTLANSLGGTATVSPSKSACSETEIRVDVGFSDLIARMKQGIMDEAKRADIRMKQEIMDEVNSRMDRVESRLNGHVAESSFISLW